MKKVSVIVPVYNVEAYIDKCLDSLVNQTLKDIEIIVVNDGSPDNSQKIIDKYAKKYPNKVKAYIKENGGLSDARNYGLKHATGEYISFVDSDDYLDDDAYEKLYNFAIKKDADIVCFNLKFIYPDGTVSYMYGGTDEVIKPEEYIIGASSACTKFYKRNFLEKVNFKFTKGITSEDIAIIPSLIIHTNKVFYLENCNYNYIQRNGSIANKDDYNPNAINAYKSIIKLKEEFINAKTYEKYQSEIEYLFVENCLITIPLKVYKYKEGIKDINEVSNFIKKNYPKWKRNKYVKNLTFKEKIYANLFFYKKINLIKFLYNTKHLLKGEKNEQN